MQEPSVQTLIAVTDVELVLIRKPELTRLYDEHKIYERLGRLMAERIFCKVEVQRKNMLRKTPEELYRDFLEQYPEVVQHTPQYYIASYLGLSPEHLSRLRRKMHHG